MHEQRVIYQMASKDCIDTVGQCDCIEVDDKTTKFSPHKYNPTCTQIN